MNLSTLVWLSGPMSHGVATHDAPGHAGARTSRTRTGTLCILHMARPNVDDRIAHDLHCPLSTISDIYERGLVTRSQVIVTVLYRSRYSEYATIVSSSWMRALE